MLSKRSVFLKLATISVVTFATQNTAQTVEIDGEITNMTETEMTLQDAQDAMDPLSLLEAYVIDKNAPRNARGGWGKRGSNIYQVGEQIDAVIYLANVGKHNPGQDDNPQEMELYINFRDKAGNLLQQLRPAHTFRGVRRIEDPLQDDYFRDRFTVSARLMAPGRYDVGFVFVDRTRPAEKQIELEVPIEVIIEDAEAQAQLTDLTDMMERGEAEVSYTTLRCAALFQAQTGLFGTDHWPEDTKTAIAARERYFTVAHALIRAASDTVTEDEAMAQTIEEVRQMALLYSIRMKRNFGGGNHPWRDDLMLRRDETGCNIIYDQRERDL